MNRSVLIIFIVLILTAFGFIFFGPQAKIRALNQPKLSTFTSNQIIEPQPMTVQTKPRLLTGSIDIPIVGKKLRVVLFAGLNRILDAAAPSAKFRFILPARTKSVALMNLTQLPLPYGDGRLVSSTNTQGVIIRPVVYQDNNNNSHLDEGEPSAQATFSQSGIAPDLRGFYNNQLILLSGAAQLQDVQDSKTGAKAYYTYKLDLKAGWNMLQGEFGSGGYNVTDVAGSAWDLVVPFKPQIGFKAPTQ